jgi:hypothetical protein
MHPLYLNRAGMLILYDTRLVTQEKVNNEKRGKRARENALRPSQGTIFNLRKFLEGIGQPSSLKLVSTARGMRDNGIIFRCWKTGQPYNEISYLDVLKKRHQNP